MCSLSGVCRQRAGHAISAMWKASRVCRACRPYNNVQGLQGDVESKVSGDLGLWCVGCLEYVGRCVWRVRCVARVVCSAMCRVG